MGELAKTQVGGGSMTMNRTVVRVGLTASAWYNTGITIPSHVKAVIVISDVGTNQNRIYSYIFDGDSFAYNQGLGAYLDVAPANFFIQLSATNELQIKSTSSTYLSWQIAAVIFKG